MTGPVWLEASAHKTIVSLSLVPRLPPGYPQAEEGRGEPDLVNMVYVTNQY